MAIAQLSSTNPNLSWVINKNPQSGMVAKTIRKGNTFGWYSYDEDYINYNIYFEEGKDEISFKQYKDQEFEYININKYNSPIFVLSAIDEFFRDAYKGKEKSYQYDLEDNVENHFFINMMFIRSFRFVEFFDKHFKHFNIEVNQVKGKNYQVKVFTDKSIYQLLNFINTFVIINSIVNGDYLDLNNDNIAKYMNCLNVIDAPYYIRYLFKIKMVKKKDEFKKYKNDLENCSYQNIEMNYSDTWTMRKDKIESLLDFNNHILDYGAGEGKYIPHFAKKNNIQGKKYYVFDPDQESLNACKNRIERKEIENAQLFSSLDECINSIPQNEKVDVIMTEVIEHVEKEEAQIMIKEILNLSNLNKLIITTPCADFNQFFFDDENEKRHKDHKFEMSQEEFQNFISSIIYNDKYEFIDLGDKVNDIPVSQGVIISN